MGKKKIYFLSDVHLGAASHKRTVSNPHFNKSTSHEPESSSLYPQHEIERKLCRWLDKVKEDAEAIYLVGDIFDYWFEYKNVIPRGFTRFLGKIGEIADLGIEVHFFIGNHDIWLTDYIQNECGVIIHREPLVKSFADKKFFISHGDGLRDESTAFKIIRKIFHSDILRVPFAAIHPRWTMSFAHAWSKHSRENGETPDYFGEDKEHLVLFAKEELKRTPDINFFIFGHRHIMLDLMLAQKSRIVILGDWIQFFSYGVFDGENFCLEVFEE